SFYPRTEVLCVNGMAWYHDAQGAEKESETNEGADPVARELARSRRLAERLAAALIERLDAARAQPPVAPCDRPALLARYRWALTCPGGGLAKLADDDAWVDALVDRKIAAGIYSGA
ncbi:MAG: hypothetical protein AAGD86_02615, partial [Pseudomonadota bacterium]